MSRIIFLLDFMGLSKLASGPKSKGRSPILVVNVVDPSRSLGGPKRRVFQTAKQNHNCPLK